MRKAVQSLRSAAYHEAGHAVAAFQMGLKTKAILLIAKDGSPGRHSLRSYIGGMSRNLGRGPRAQRRAENLAFVCLAGPAAQRRFSPKSIRRYTSETDRRQAIDLLSRFTNSDEELRAYCRLLEARTRRTIARPEAWRLVEGLADRLLEKGSMTGAEVGQVIRESSLQSARP